MQEIWCIKNNKGQYLSRYGEYSPTDFNYCVRPPEFADDWQDAIQYDCRDDAEKDIFFFYKECRAVHVGWSVNKIKRW